MANEPLTAPSYEVLDFEEQVMRRSHDLPVLVDFWAPWCGPCRFLGPIIEKLAGEADGRWELVKVNTEVHQELAMRFQIRGIPNVKLFHKGEVIGELAGALPEPQLKQWVDMHLPTPGRELFLQAIKELEQERMPEAQALLRQVLDLEPGHEQARLLLARTLVLASPADVEDLLERHTHLPDAEALLDLARVVRMDDNDLAEGHAKDPMRQGIEAVKANDASAALEHWITAVERDKHYMDQLPRRACVALFNLLGREHPLYQHWRRRFDTALN